MVPLILMQIISFNEGNELYAIRSICLLGLTKSIELFENLNKLEMYFTFKWNDKYFIEIIKILFLLIGVSHIFGCIFHSIALLEIKYLDSHDTWLHKRDITENSLTSR